MPHKALQNGHTKGTVEDLFESSFFESASSEPSHLLARSVYSTRSLGFVLPFMHEVDPQKGHLLTRKRRVFTPSIPGTQKPRFRG